MALKVYFQRVTAKMAEVFRLGTLEHMYNSRCNCSVNRRECFSMKELWCCWCWPRPSQATLFWVENLLLTKKLCNTAFCRWDVNSKLSNYIQARPDQKKSLVPRNRRFNVWENDFFFQILSLASWSSTYTDFVFCVIVPTVSWYEQKYMFNMI